MSQLLKSLQPQHQKKICEIKKILHRSLLHWYKLHKRPLPWRNTNDPYHILVSEVMLQQTQVSRVITKYKHFLEEFPTIGSLANASFGKVLRLWSGLGYNSRALRLHKTTKIIVQKYNSLIPQDPEGLINLPGIGKYTAHAISSFAYNKPVPLVDTNIQRIFQRFFPHIVKGTSLWSLAKALLPEKQTSEWNQALMELGSLVCTFSNPLCTQCPWQKYCSKTIENNPKKKKKKPEPQLRGIPRRIWRGKVIALLRNHQSLSLRKLCSLLQLSNQEQEWLKNVLQQMRKEGLISIHKNIVSLPQ